MDSAKIHYNSTGPSAAAAYTVTFSLNNGSGSTTEKEYKSGDTLGTLPAPTRTGYKFNGWYTAASGGTKVSAATSVTKDMALYAQWTKTPIIKTYTIKLDSNSGAVSPSSIQVESGKTYLTSLPTPTRKGYKFDGWYTARTGGTKITATTKATASRTVYARWTRTRTYMVTFDPNGGTVFQEWKAVVTGASYRTLPTPTRRNYHFKGWYTKPSGGVKVTQATRASLTANQTMYAQWQSTATARTTQPGSWQVTVPAGYPLALYATSTSAKVSATLEKDSYQTIRCTRKATLSNGTVRYYGKVNSRSYWFTYSCEMDV